MDRQVACSSVGFEQRCSPVCWCDAAIDFPPELRHEGGFARLGLGQEAAAPGAAALARGFFVRRVAGDTPARAFGVAETVDAGNSVSPMGSRAAHVRQQSRDGVGKCGDRAIRGRSRANHMD